MPADRVTCVRLNPGKNSLVMTVDSRDHGKFRYRISYLSGDKDHALAVVLWICHAASAYAQRELRLHHWPDLAQQRRSSARIISSAAIASRVRVIRPIKVPRNTPSSDNRARYRHSRT
jgi:hypothetical protein